MSYTPTVWQDLPSISTPITAARLNNIETGIANASAVAGTLPIQGVVAAAAFAVKSLLVAGDTQPAFQINGDGSIHWGQGGSTSADTNLYRQAAGILRTDGRLFVGPNVGVTDALIVAANATGNQIEFGHTNPAGYRSVLGAMAGSGSPFLAFYAQAGLTANTFKTTGQLGSLFLPNNAGGFIFASIPNANADNQNPITLATLNNAGVLNVIGGFQVNGVSTELAYAQIVAAVNITHTTEPTADLVVTAPSVNFDGVTPVLIEFYAPNILLPAGIVGMNCYLYQDGVSIGGLGYWANNVAGTSIAFAVGTLVRRMVPTAGAHVYSIRFAIGAGTGSVSAGPTSPAFIRIARAI